MIWAHAWPAAPKFGPRLTNYARAPFFSLGSISVPGHRGPGPKFWARPTGPTGPLGPGPLGPWAHEHYAACKILFDTCAFSFWLAFGVVV